VQDAIGQAGAPVKAVAGVAATGSITISAYASIDPADTITVGGTTLAWVASNPGAGEVAIGGSNGATRDNLLAALEAIAEDEGVVVASSSTAAITVTAAATGTAGNSIALAKSGDGVTVSGSGSLASGVNQVKGTAAPAGSIRVGGGKAYVALTDCTEADTSGWKELTTGSGL
jgi:phage tail sheath gpL-like